MKRVIIGTIVTGLILFFWQFLSWSMLQVHGDEFTYTPKQDEIIRVLSEHLTEDGSYFLPGAPPGATSEEHQAVMESGLGKPWARISYHKEMQMNFGMNMFRAIVIDMIAAFLFIWMLLRFKDLDFKTTLISSLSIGMIVFFTVPYLNSIWFETSVMGYFVDAIIPWGIIGVFLGWFLNRKV